MRGVGTHQDVEAAELVAHPRRERGDGGRVGDVEPAEPHGAAGGPDRRGGGLPARLVPRREHHGQALLRQARRERQTDAPVRARHHGHRLPRPPRRRPATTTHGQGNGLSVSPDQRACGIQ